MFPALDPGIAPGAQAKLSFRVALLHDVGQEQAYMLPDYLC